MDFVAYHENKCSQQSVLEYIIYLILREKEPQIMEVGKLIAVKIYQLAYVKLLPIKYPLSHDHVVDIVTVTRVQHSSDWQLHFV